MNSEKVQSQIANIMFKRADIGFNPKITQFSYNPFILLQHIVALANELKSFEIYIYIEKHDKISHQFEVKFQTNTYKCVRQIPIESGLHE